MTWPIFNPLLITRRWNPALSPPNRPGAPTSSPQKGLWRDQGAPMPELQELPLTAVNLGREGLGANPGLEGGPGPTHNSVTDIRE